MAGAGDSCSEFWLALWYDIGESILSIKPWKFKSSTVDLVETLTNMMTHFANYHRAWRDKIKEVDYFVGASHFLSPFLSSAMFITCLQRTFHMASHPSWFEMHADCPFERGLPFQPTFSALRGLKAHYFPRLDVQLKMGSVSKDRARPFAGICYLLVSEPWPPKWIFADFARDVTEQLQTLLYGINDNIS